MFCEQAGLQAVLCDWEESLTGLCAWRRPNAMLSSEAGPQAGVCCRAGLWDGLQGFPGSLLKLPGYAGPDAILDSWGWRLAWLPSGL